MSGFLGRKENKKYLFSPIPNCCGLDPQGQFCDYFLASIDLKKAERVSSLCGFATIDHYRYDLLQVYSTAGIIHTMC